MSKPDIVWLQVDPVLGNDISPEQILDHAKKGEMHKVSDYFLRRGSRALTTYLRNMIVHEIIKNPAEFHAPLKTFSSVTFRDFNYQELFVYLEDEDPGMDVTSACWSIRERAPSPGIQNISAELLAERFRYEILKNGSYAPDPASLIDVESDAFKLSHAMARANKLAHFIITQNALVRYVAENAKSLPAHRGAVFLDIIRDDVESTLWSQKMKDVREVRVESLQDGSSLRWKAVYEPTP